MTALAVLHRKRAMHPLSHRSCMVVALAAAATAALAIDGALGTGGSASGVPTDPFGDVGQSFYAGFAAGVSTNSEATRKHIQDAMALLMMQWGGLASQEFAWASLTDSDCVMAYWGQALSQWRWDFGSTSLSDARTAVTEMKSALARPGVNITQRERMYATAVERLFQEGVAESARVNAYLVAMKNITTMYPDDFDAVYLRAAGLIATAYTRERGYVQRGWENMELARTLLEGLMERVPGHPAVAILYVMSSDTPELAESAIDPSASLARNAPDAPGAHRIRSRLFMRLGLWANASAANDQALAASFDFNRNSGAEGFSALDYDAIVNIVFCDLQRGRFSEAFSSIDGHLHNNVQQHPADYIAASREALARAHFIAEAGGWSTVTDEPRMISCTECEASTDIKRALRGDLLFVTHANAAQLYVYGVANTLRSNVTGARWAANKLNDMVLSLLQPPVDSFNVDFVASELLAVYAQIQAAMLIAEPSLENLTAAADQLTDVVATLLDTLPVGFGLPFPVVPVTEMLAAVLYHNGDYEAAFLEYQITLTTYINRAQSVLGLARTASQLGRTDAALDYFKLFLILWADADPGRPELQEAQMYILDHSPPDPWPMTPMQLGVISGGSGVVVGILFASVVLICMYRRRADPERAALLSGASDSAKRRESYTTSGRRPSFLVAGVDYDVESPTARAEEGTSTENGEAAAEDAAVADTKEE